MASKRVVKEMALVFNTGDAAAVVKKKVSDAITILDKGGYEVCGMKLAFFDTGRKTTATAPKTRRPRQPRVAAVENGTLTGTEGS